MFDVITTFFSKIKCVCIYVIIACVLLFFSGDKFTKVADTSVSDKDKQIESLHNDLENCKKGLENCKDQIDDFKQKSDSKNKKLKGSTDEIDKVYDDKDIKGVYNRIVGGYNH